MTSRECDSEYGKTWFLGIGTAEVVHAELIRLDSGARSCPRCGKVFDASHFKEEVSSAA